MLLRIVQHIHIHTYILKSRHVVACLGAQSDAWTVGRWVGMAHRSHGLFSLITCNSLPSLLLLVLLPLPLRLLLLLFGGVCAFWQLALDKSFQSRIGCCWVMFRIIYTLCHHVRSFEH